jgi:hypothetical protein
MTKFNENDGGNIMENHVIFFQKERIIEKDEINQEEVHITKSKMYYQLKQLGSSFISDSSSAVFDI